MTRRTYHSRRTYNSMRKKTLRRRKKYRGGSSRYEEIRTNFRDILEKYFGNDYGNIVVNTEPNRVAFSFFYKDQKYQNECFDIYVSRKEIDTLYVDGIKYINQIKCLMSGPQILKGLYRAAKEMGLNYIKLSDASVFNFETCYIDLHDHHILLHGNSWYNKFGYYSKNYKKELIDNRIFETRVLEFYREDNIEICDDMIIFMEKYGKKITYQNTIRKIVKDYDSLLKDKSIKHCDIVTGLEPFISLLKINYSDMLVVARCPARTYTMR
jgi:hypothetical protein